MNDAEGSQWHCCGSTENINRSQNMQEKIKISSEIIDTYNICKEDGFILEIACSVLLNKFILRAKAAIIIYCIWKLIKSIITLSK